MTIFDILNKWAAYSEYDENQKKFNLGSLNYEYHVIGEKVQEIIKNYDSSGKLAVVYIKRMFEQLMKKVTVTAWDVLSHNDGMDEERDIFEMFNSKEVLSAEKEIVSMFQNAYLKITGGRQIGENKNLENDILNSIIQAIDSMKKTHEMLFLKGSTMRDLNKSISPNLLVFNTMAECILNIERANDGLYLCFIRAEDSASCFFTYIAKSNGNILSVNDMYQEAFAGQNIGSRNARWTEEKAANLFPYDSELFQYSEHDYKGYATKYKMNEGIGIYELGEKTFLPVIAGFLLVSLKYSNKDIDLPLSYIDTLLPMNMEKMKGTEIIPTGKSEIMSLQSSANLNFEADKILSGEYAKEFDWNTTRGHYTETGCFSNLNQIMVDLWGEGFVYDPSKDSVNISNANFLLGSGGEQYISEFIGTEKRQRMQVYQNIRKQLADYMWDQIYKEWLAFGELEGVKKWYKSELEKSMPHIMDIMIETEKHGTDYEDNTKVFQVKDGNVILFSVIMSEERKAAYNYISPSYERLFGCYFAPEKRDFLDETDGCGVNVTFTFTPFNWKGIEKLIGKEVPKIVKGWNHEGHDYYGNPILNAHDEVEKVSTPMDINRNKKRERIFGKSEFDFKFVYGFSKKHWNKLKKERRNV